VFCLNERLFTSLIRPSCDIFKYHFRLLCRIFFVFYYLKDRSGIYYRFVFVQSSQIYIIIYFIYSIIIIYF